MKHMNLVVAMLVALALNGCSFLASKGVLAPEDTAALCKDASVACSVAVLVDADEDVRKACAAIAALCVAQ